MRILDQWDSLRLYFTEAATVERSYLVGELSNMYNDNSNYAYLVFLKSILKQVTDVNKQFQSESGNPLRLVDSLVSLFEKVLQRIMLPTKFMEVTTSNIASYDFLEGNKLRRPDLMEMPYEFHECFPTTNRVNNFLTLTDVEFLAHLIECCSCCTVFYILGESVTSCWHQRRTKVGHFVTMLRLYERIGGSVTATTS